MASILDEDCGSDDSAERLDDLPFGAQHAEGGDRPRLLR